MMPCKKFALNFKKRYFEENKKLAIFKSMPLPFGSVYFNETWHICYYWSFLVTTIKSARICVNIFGDSVIQTLKSGKTLKTGLVPMSRQEKLADLFLVFPASLET